MKLEKKTLFKYTAPIVISAFLGVNVISITAKTLKSNNQPSYNLQVADFEKETLNPTLSNIKTIKLSNLKGKVVLLNFYGVDCSPCEMETPYLNDLYKKLRKQGLVIIGISSIKDTSIKKDKEFIKKFNIVFPVVKIDYNMARKYGVYSLPMLILLDRHGRQKKIQVGIPDKTFYQALNEELKKS